MPVHSTAIVDPRAEVDESVEIGPRCVIDEHVRIGAGCRILFGAYLTGWTQIGEECILHPGSIVGHAPQDTKYKGERSFCRVGPRTIFREYATVHRGSGVESETVIGADCMLHVGAHVGHNASVGDRVVLGNHVLLAGHTQVGDDVTMGPGTGLHQFTRIGEWTRVESAVTIRQDIVPFASVSADDHIAGVNEDALETFSEAEVEDLRALFHVFLSGHRSFSELPGRLGDAARTAPGRRFVEFVNVGSQRGFAGGKAPDGHRTTGQSSNAG